MKTQTVNQEILLFTGTSFAGRELCSRDAENIEGRIISSHDKLEKACWNGLLGELLPELVDAADSKIGYFIWQVISADNFLCVSMGTNDEPVLSESSIDPYWFISSINFN